MSSNTVGLHTGLASVKGVAPKTLSHFKKLGIETVRDLLWHFPSRYEDFSEITKIADLKPGAPLTSLFVLLLTRTTKLSHNPASS